MFLKNKKMWVLVLILFVLLSCVLIYIKNYDYKRGQINDNNINKNDVLIDEEDNEMLSEDYE